MGKLRNFEKIKWKPFELREGAISVRNSYTHEGRVLPTQGHLNIPRFSHFEIVRWERNEYYGKLQEYLDNGWEISFSGEFLQQIGGGRKVSLSAFTQLPETCYMLAWWLDMDGDEKSPDLTFIGSRPLRLSEEEQAVFMRLAREGQEHIERVLNGFDEFED